MKSKIKYILLGALGVLFSCNNANDQKTRNNDEKTSAYSEIEKAGWLIGAWQNNSPEGSATEIWEKKNDSTFAGNSYFIVGVDTVSLETISLEQHGKELFYIPTVKVQNAGQPVKFKLTSITDKNLVFENPLHDFPQKISYTKISDSYLSAEISGIMEGNQKSQKFQFVRVGK
jgi:hypothetical protein